MTEEQAKYIDPRARFACKCCGRNEIDPRLEGMVRTIEAHVGQPLVINSGYRCPKHNQAVGGSPTSSHLKGLACDIATPGSRDRYHVLNAAIRLGIDRIGVYQGFIHLDIDRTKDHRVVWMAS